MEETRISKRFFRRERYFCSNKLLIFWKEITICMLRYRPRIIIIYVPKTKFNVNLNSIKMNVTTFGISPLNKI